MTAPAQAPNDARLHASVAQLFVYPVKSCAGVALDRAELLDTGFDLDRAWMVVDAHGDFVTQRDLPRMALVKPQIKHLEVVLRAPGMLALHLGINEVDSPARVTVWKDTVDAWDMGGVAAQWFSDFLGRPGLRLVRFDPEVRRLASAQWTGEVQAPIEFADGFPLLVTSTASLAELNTRLAAAGHAPVGIERFRANIVLDGVHAHDEDRIDELVVASAGGEVRLKLVKPCARCPIPNVDPATGDSTPAVLDALQGYRADPRLDGALTFGMNAIVLAGTGQTLRVGDVAQGEWRFD
ncbi:MOSC domain-containing protein [Ottowia sp. GY511]|uniref:MOSC domain-containing protein n=1 Tax=Ottowia flava TaxID=2675430 RepID=A0ABW4KWG5_9BURK|nr:MOSC N-terminal beta barrel domain-containing protein [Ottowia sp. GY511]TXK22505.1 MOSC domain-containing protein [Ottowia sp. GY511]